MTGRVIKLLFVLVALFAVRDILQQDNLHALESDCHCHLDGSGGAFIYLDDWTFVNQRTGSATTPIQPTGTPYGTYYCSNFCVSFANSLMGQLCSTYGTGHKVDYHANWSYEDPDNSYGGSGSGFLSGGPFECN
jgi:hypothetical protein